MNKKSQKRLFGVKGIVLAVCIALAVGSAAVGTVAFMSRKTEPMEMGFDPTEVSCEVVETKGGYRISNTGETAVYVRVLPVITWQNDGQIYVKKQPVENEDYSITYNTDDWFMDGGYYYYRLPLYAGCLTTDLIEDFEVADVAEAPEGYSLTLELAVSVIQSNPENAVSDNWGMSVGSSGRLGK